MPKPKSALIVVLGFAIVIVYLLWPVCLPLTNEEVASFQPPINQRSDWDMYFQVFQQQNGQWCQCKTRLSRVFFF
jgi:hypothetical protein